MFDNNDKRNSCIGEDVTKNDVYVVGGMVLLVFRNSRLCDLEL